MSSMLKDLFTSKKDDSDNDNDSDSISEIHRTNDFVVVDETEAESPPLPPPSGRSLEGSLNLSLSCSHEIIGKEDPRTIAHYVATLRAADLENEEKRSPIDVMVAMDVSGSMSGEKLTMCKETCEILIKELRSDDRFGICAFSQNSEMVFPLSQLSKSKKEFCLNKVKRMTSGGCTNLSGGLTMAVREILNPAEKAADVRAVLILTDGHANRGVSDSSGILKLLKGCIGDANNISLNAFGYGTDHDAELLKAMTEVSSCQGSYYFIENNDNVSSAFGDCLGGLLSVAAQNIQLFIRGRGIRVLHDRSSRKEEGSYVVDIGDIFAEETRDIVIETTLDEAIDKIEVSVNYIDVFQSNFVKSDLIACQIQRPSGKEISLPSSYVALQIMRIDIIEAIKVANEHAKQNKLLDARKHIEKAIEKIEADKNNISPVSEEKLRTIQLFIADLNDALSGLKNEYEYVRYGSKKMMSKFQNHSAQRSNANDEEEDDLYRGERKRGMARKMKAMMLSIKHE